MKIPMLRFLRRKPKFNRSFLRFSCKIDTTLTLIDRMFNVEGRVIDISQGGAMFRPRLAYIMDRSGVPVCIHLGAEELFGHIVTTSPAGFSIRFDEPLDEDIFMELTAEFREADQKAA